MDLAFIIAILAVLLGVGGVGWYVWWRMTRTKEAPEPAQDWDPNEAVHRLVRHSDELKTLYAGLGYDLDVEAHAARLMDALKRTIRTEIPDFSALWEALNEAPVPQTVSPPVPGLSVPDPHPAEVLLREVVSAGPDEERVRGLLNRAPMDEPVPFAEVLPVSRDGAVTWRPVMEVTLVRKRPADPDRFRQVLEHVEALVRTSPLERSAQATTAVLKAIDRLRAALARPEVNLALALTHLDEQLAQWLHRAHLQDEHARKQELDAFLHRLVALRHTCLPPGDEPLKVAARTTCNREVQRLVVAYLEAPLMHASHLTVLLLTALIDLRLSTFTRREQDDPGTPAGVLSLVRDEIASGYYDAPELIRRLRAQETRGFFVHSLVHALLQL